MTEELILFEQPKIIKVGKPFYDDSLPDALEKAQEYAGKDGHVMSFPELADAKILANKNDYVWNNWFTLATEEDKGKTKRGNPVYVVSHGKGILTNPDRIRQAYDKGLVNGAARFTKTEFNNLLKGKLPGKTEIPVFSYADFIKQTELPLTYAVVLDFNKVKEMKSGVQDFDSLRDNELVIARLGGVERAGRYLDKSKEVYGSRLGNWHDCERVDLDVCVGRLVFAGSYYNYDLIGCDSINYDGRFVGVPMHAEGVALDSTGNEGIVKPKLEQILNLAIGKGFVAERLQEQFKKELHKLYE